jgi:exodeoxyribonuclease V gamma subunit
MRQQRASVLPATSHHRSLTAVTSHVSLLVFLSSNISAAFRWSLASSGKVFSITGACMQSRIEPGFIAFHSNRLENLKQAVFEVVRQYPLAPLEDEVFLVQSNGLADWIKMSMATELNVCAATRVLLPARFLWELYRDMLGREAVPGLSPFDRAPLVWRMMKMLPLLVREDGFEPLQRFIGSGDEKHLYQLAERLAALMDVYQIYRSDWLKDWQQGAYLLRHPAHESMPLDEGNRWQARLWSRIVADVAEDRRADGRHDVHERFMRAMQGDVAPVFPLPRRVIVIGNSSMPPQTLEALSALSTRAQVVLAVNNPCRFYWGDIMNGKELFSARPRHESRHGADRLGISPEDMHLHSHPLLASWGQLGRDHVRMLDAYDDTQAAKQLYPQLRLDVFHDEDGDTLLGRLQCGIRDLLPLCEHPERGSVPGDDSIEFHIAHSAQREVEILHDRVLGMLKESGGALRPRDIVVMVPDIELFAPAIHATFGRFSGTNDDRRIPYDIADMAERRANPVLIALEWIMRLPAQRCLQSEIRDLLDVPAIRAHFGLDEASCELLGRWIENAGVRWGLNDDHRKTLGLAPAGLQNSWLFGLRRMLLGYANGFHAPYDDIEPLGEIGGLDAVLVSSLEHFISALLEWRITLSDAAPPLEWNKRAHEIMDTFFKFSTDRERLTRARLQQSLRNWTEQCKTAGFDQPVSFDIFCDAWLGSVDEMSLSQRFVSGGVTFCTLLPMRAIPFNVVCLLGMNEGDFPRRATHADFDLLALPGQARPGDRSRRNDDRYLMLEAVLSARTKLYVSWVGRSIRDNSALPPSLLVAQLRDYLEKGWGADLASMTTVHPMQPFSRTYFDDQGLTTFAREWYATHLPVPSAGGDVPAWSPQPGHVLTLREIESFMKSPVNYFYRNRMQVVFARPEASGADIEPFKFTPLDEYAIHSLLLEDGETVQEAASEVVAVMTSKAQRLVREGKLPMKAFGDEVREELVRTLTPSRVEWLHWCGRYPKPAGRIAVSLEHQGVLLQDFIDNVRTDGAETVLLVLNCRKLLDKKGEKVSLHKMFHAWLQNVAAAASGTPCVSYIVCCDEVFRLAPPHPEAARKILEELIECWLDGMGRPLPTACKTALVYLSGQGEPRDRYEGNDRVGGEITYDMALARQWPDYETLSSHPDWDACTRKLYERMFVALNDPAACSRLGFTAIDTLKEAA